MERTSPEITELLIMFRLFAQTVMSIAVVSGWDGSVSSKALGMLLLIIIQEYIYRMGYLWWSTK